MTRAKLSRPISLLTLGVFAAMIPTSPLAAADNSKLIAYGRHLARECTSCHRLDGVDNGIPSIVGWPTDAFATTMKFYREGARTNPVMVSVARSLTDDQLKALALFFASMPPPTTKNPLPAEGKTKK